MKKEIVKKIIRMIEKECCRNSLDELCEYWNVTTDDFEEFLANGYKASIEVEE